MKITRFEVIPVKQLGLLLTVHSDTELVGYGSPMNYEHGRTVTRAIHDMEDYLADCDPRQIEDHWQTLFRCATWIRRRPWSASSSASPRSGRPVLFRYLKLG